MGVEIIKNPPGGSPVGRFYSTIGIEESSPGSGYGEVWLTDIPFDGDIVDFQPSPDVLSVTPYVNGHPETIPFSFPKNSDIMFAVTVTPGTSNGAAILINSPLNTQYDESIQGPFILAEYGTMNNCGINQAHSVEHYYPNVLTSHLIVGGFNRSAFTLKTATVGDGDFTIEWEQGCLPYVLGIGFNAGTFAGNWDTNTDFTLAIPTFNGSLYVWENGAGPYSNARNSWVSGIYFTGGTGTRYRVKVDIAGTVTYEVAPPNSAYQVVYTSAVVIPAATVLYGVVGIYAPGDAIEGIKLTGPWL